ncbi:hypothetical protein IFM89_033320, partial [Coptis chinensis]
TSKLEVLGSNDNYSSFSSTSMVRSCQAPLSVHEDMPFIVVQCHVSENEGKEVVSSDSVEEMSTEIEPHPECRSRIEDKSRDAAALLYSPSKSTSQVTEFSDVWATPGTIVWARTGREVWWPAEVLEGRSAAVATSDEGFDGHILVQYYGNHEIAMKKGAAIQWNLSKMLLNKPYIESNILFLAHSWIEVVIGWRAQVRKISLYQNSSTQDLQVLLWNMTGYVEIGLGACGALLYSAEDSFKVRTEVSFVLFLNKEQRELVDIAIVRR